MSQVAVDPRIIALYQAYLKHVSQHQPEVAGSLTLAHIYNEHGTELRKGPPKQTQQEMIDELRVRLLVAKFVDEEFKANHKSKKSKEKV